MILAEHIKNRNEFPPEELAKYQGKHVAWNQEGTAIVASGADDGKVIQAVRAAGLNLGQVIFSYVPFPDEIFLGGASLCDEEVGSSLSH